MGKARAGQVIVFDAGALIALEKRDPRLRALLRELTRDDRILLPATVLAQVWRRPAEQVALRSLVTSARAETVALDGALAEAVGVLLARTKTRDVVDASVVLIARRAGGTVFTSDPDDLRVLDPALPLITV